MIQKTTLHPSRIGCPSIPGTMKGIIMSVKGVQDVNVRYEDRSIDVTFDDAHVSIEQIIKAVGNEMGLALELGKDGEKKDGNVAETCPM
ncbi:MAG: heavy-metal-associated domain-containing protein [bacterium]|nr:heavy-metal-associated domain-containing protein [bacterium]